MALTFQKGESDKIFITKLTHNGDLPLTKLSLNNVPYWSGYFAFTLLEDGTLSVKARDVNNLPSHLVIPSSYNGKNVTEIGSSAFSGASIRSVYIPPSMVIRDHAFSRCEELVQINDNNDIHTEIIGEYAFGGCKKLGYVALHNIEKIGDGAFYGGGSSTNVFYMGSSENWKENVDNLNSELDEKNMVYFYTEEQPTTDGQFWREDNAGHYVVWGSDCFDIYTSKHSFSISSEENPTCTDKGHTTYTCSKCGWHYVVKKEATGHTWQEATCITPKICFACGATRGKARGHTWGECEITSPQDCEAAGVAKRTCKVCGETENIEFGTPIGHDMIMVGMVSPTCTTQGYITEKCSRCGKTETRVFGAPLEHHWSEWDIKLEPTCISAGTKECFCLNCGKPKIAEIEPIGHSPDLQEIIDPTCTEKGYTSYICADCGELYNADYTEALGHEWGESYQDEITGDYYLVCSRCGQKGIVQAELFTYTPLDDGSYSVSGKDGLAGDIFIPREYNGIPVTAIGDYAFLFRPSIKSVIIPIGITSIGKDAFNDCANLTRVEMPASVTFIGDSAFYKCPSLVRVELPEGIESISRWMFAFCRKLEGVNIPASVISIGDYAFTECISIERIILPDGVTYIGKYAFDGCYSLTKIFIPAEVTKIGYGAFRDCPNLSIEVDENNKSYRMKDGCLWEIKTNTIIYGEYEDIPEDTTAIGDGAFYGNTYFAPIKIPLSVKTIGSLAFGGKPVTVYCAASSKPADWADDWCDENVEVVWGYTEGGDSCSHKYGRWTITATPTCTRFGSMQSTCSICGEVEMKPIPPLGHNYEEDFTEPTCTEKGSRTYTCSRCGHSYTEEIEAVGHSWSDWDVVLPAECEINGMRERKCTVCGEIETEIIAALGHMNDVETIEPTCTEGGYTKYICIHCGHTYNSNFTDPLGHFLIDGVCVRCGHTEKSGVYYGVSAIPERYNSSFILGLEHQEAADSHLDSISVTPLEGEYIYYCAPTLFGDCAFAYNNFVGGFTLIIEGLALTNAGGKTESYNIYKSNQANLGVNGAITITIKEMG